MNKGINFVCLVISILPVIVLLFLYNNLGALMYTKISGPNGLSVSKSNFLFFTIFFSILFYYASILISQRLINFSSIISQPNLRSLINVLFSILTILLILSNLQALVIPPETHTHRGHRPYLLKLYYIHRSLPNLLYPVLQMAFHSLLVLPQLCR